MNGGPPDSLSSSEAHNSPTIIDPVVIRKYGHQGSRYSAYPSFDRFVEAVDARAHGYWLAHRRIGGMVRPLAVYAHASARVMPALCADGSSGAADSAPPVTRYLAHLDREMALVSARLGQDRTVNRLIVGGGLARFLVDDDCRSLARRLRAVFGLHGDGDQEITLDPRHVALGRIGLLAELGFNRIGFRCAGREQRDLDPGFRNTIAAIAAARKHGFRSIGAELVYASPLEPIATFDTAVTAVIDAGVDRVALHAYRSQPAMGAVSPAAAEVRHPPAAELDLLIDSLRRLLGAGFLHIAMDQFARPGDDLAIAHAQGRLTRDVHGYSAGGEADLIGLGIGAIGKVGPLYCQNTPVPDDYFRMLDQGRLPILRGLELKADDVLRRGIIQALACQFMVSRESITIAHLIDFDQYFAPELRELEQFAADGVVTLDGDWVQLTPRGRPVVRAVCAVFDRYLRQARERSAFETPE